MTPSYSLRNPFPPPAWQWPGVIGHDRWKGPRAPPAEGLNWNRGRLKITLWRYNALPILEMAIWKIAMVIYITTIFMVI